MAVKKLTKAEQIAKIPIEDIVKLGGKEGRKQLEGYVRTLQSGYKRRVGSFVRQGLISYAQISLEASMPLSSRQIKDMSRNQLILEIARYQKFFNDKTSSIKGIMEVNKEQDIRIFGSDKKGRPRKTMTQEERTQYWSLYDEFLNQNPNASSKYGSESVQQQIAEAMFSQQDSIGTNLVSFLDDVRERLSAKSQEENLRSVPNVYSGRGPVR